MLDRLKSLISRKQIPSGHLNPKDLGRLGEDYAYEYLKRENYAVLERNYRCFLGEVDIIARQSHTIVFVEVKTQYAHVEIPIEWKINSKKRKKLQALSRFYRSSNLAQTTECRIDVVTIKINKDNSIQELKHYKRAV